MIENQRYYLQQKQIAQACYLEKYLNKFQYKKLKV